MSSINQLNSSFGKSDIQIINQFIIEEEEEKRKLEYKRERESQEKKPKQILASMVSIPFSCSLYAFIFSIRPMPLPS